MHFDGSYAFEAGRAAVHAPLLDPEVLRSCIRGCERLEEVATGRYQYTIVVGLAALRGTVRGQVELTDVRPGEGLHVAIKGRGGPGVLHGTAEVTLKEEPLGTTTVTVAGSGALSGPISGAAAPILGGVARLLLNDLFDCLRRKVGGGP